MARSLQQVFDKLEATNAVDMSGATDHISAIEEICNNVSLVSKELNNQATVTHEKF